mmetsp:Transcript_27998/g.45489  ORF Transcript_27998/g.45489 Transcript_27998/m.45489 type:complete len:138 (+) Transcript_27998:53-466(+)
MEPANKKIKAANDTSGDGNGNGNGPASFFAPIAVIEVPTKTYDGGTPRSPMTHENRDDGGDLHQDPKLRDPFLYYSNDAHRLSYLLAHREDNGSEPEPPTERKTRLSFEVHPDLLFHDNNMSLSNAAAAALEQKNSQ